MNYPPSRHRRGIWYTALNSRKLNRLKNYDYSSNGLYFVTICTKNRVQHVNLTEYGKILNDQIIEMNSIYTDKEIMKYVIMPDHLHMIIYLFNDKNVCGTSRTPSPTNAVIPSMISTLKRFVNKKIGFDIWQRSFHDHIIRNENELRQLWQYIDNNPINWASDIYNQNSWR